MQPNPRNNGMRYTWAALAEEPLNRALHTHPACQCHTKAETTLYVGFGHRGDQLVKQLNHHARAALKTDGCAEHREFGCFYTAQITKQRYTLYLGRIGGGTPEPSIAHLRPLTDATRKRKPRYVKASAIVATTWPGC